MIEQIIDIGTRAGAMETFIVHPERGDHPPVLMLMDAPGIREELYDMARRLASAGFCRASMANTALQGTRRKRRAPELER